MKESYSEGLASHTGPESCVAIREGGCEALGRGMHRLSIEPRKLTYLGVPTQCNYAEGNTQRADRARHAGTPRGRRPRACAESPRARTGRSRVCQLHASQMAAKGSPRT